MRTFDKPPLATDLTTVLPLHYHEIAEQLGWAFVARASVYDAGLFYCLALADSWIMGNCKPTAEHIRDLSSFFGISEEDIVTVGGSEPMWWMDLNSTEWHCQHKSQLVRRTQALGFGEDVEESNLLYYSPVFGMVELTKAHWHVRVMQS